MNIHIIVSLSKRSNRNRGIVAHAPVSTHRRDNHQNKGTVMIFYRSAAVLAVSLLVAVPAFAQSAIGNDKASGSMLTKQPTDGNADFTPRGVLPQTADKQPTDGNADFTPRGVLPQTATKQPTDGNADFTPRGVLPQTATKQPTDSNADFTPRGVVPQTATKQP
jgi:hypothetical protein